jgi:phage major head subunit gpT-like protein
MEQTGTRIILEGAIREALAAPAARRVAALAGGASRRASRDAGGGGMRELDVVILRSGISKNGYSYSPEVVASLAPLLDGARAFADHPGPQDRPERSVRDLVGFYRSARVEESAPAGGQPRQARVVATLHLLESADWLWSMLREALEQDMAGLVGLSIDVQAIVEARRDDASGRVINVVTRFVALNSCDVVTRPSAGGALLGIRRESARRASGHEGGTLVMGETIDLADSPSSDSPYYKEQVTYIGQGAYQGASKAQGAYREVSQEREGHASQRIRETDGWAAGNVGVQQPPDAPAAPEQLAALQADAQRALEAARQAQRLAECELLLGRRLGESHLPLPVVSKLRRRFEGRVFEANDLERAISDERETLAALANLGLIRDMGYEKPQVSSMITEAEKIQAAFDRMFDLEVDARFAGVRPFTGIREAYARVSGDPAVRGISSLSTVGMIKIDESAPVTRITESDLTTASFSYLLGTSMNKRLLHDYQAWPAEWKRFCTEVPIRDFKQQTRVRLGAFGSLSTVAEDAAYTTLTLSDAAASYSATKRGNIVTISRETIVNDDLHAIKQIPAKLAVAAAYTLAEFVYGFLSGNATIYDGNPLFDATNHGNLGTSALSSAAMQAGVTAMREQTNFANKRIGLRPKYLIVPPELEFTGMVIVKSAGIPGSNNNDINPMMGYTQLIVSPQLPAAGTPANSSWYLAADPAEVDTIEIGFVGGQVNPAMFIQDNPLYGLNFTQDSVSYKVRHEYGGAVMDWRGLYRGI